MKKGTYLLNVPVDIYKMAVKILGRKADTKIEYKKNTRSGSGKTYKEYIYIWFKK